MVYSVEIVTKTVKMSEMECKKYINLVLTFWINYLDVWFSSSVSVSVSLLTLSLSLLTFFFLFYSLSILAACTVAPLADCLYL